MSFLLSEFIYKIYKSVESGNALLIALEYTAVAEYTHECISGLPQQDIVYIFGHDIVAPAEALKPCRMLCYLGYIGNISACKHGVGNCGKLLFQAGWQHGKTHYLDKPDILFLYIMILGTRMVKSHRALRRGQIVAEHEVELVFAAAATGYRSYRIVLPFFRFGENCHGLIAVGAPCVENLRGKSLYPVSLGT